MASRTIYLDGDHGSVAGDRGRLAAPGDLVLSGAGAVSTATPSPPIVPAVLRRPLLVAAAGLLVIAGGAVEVLSSGSRAARAVARPSPSFAAAVPAPSFAGSVPALAATHPVRSAPHRRAHRTAGHHRAGTHAVSTATPASVTSGPVTSGAVTGGAVTSTPVTSTRVTSAPVTGGHSGSATHRSSSGGGSSTPAFGANGALGPGSSPSS